MFQVGWGVVIKSRFRYNLFYIMVILLPVCSIFKYGSLNTLTPIMSIIKVGGELN